MKKFDFENIRLTDKEKTFAEALVNGATVADSFRVAGYNVQKFTPKAVDAKGWKLQKKENVAKYLKFLREQATVKAVMSKREILEKMAKVARSINVDTLRGSDKTKVLIKLLEHYEKMEGLNDHGRTDFIEENRKTIIERISGIIEKRFPK